jgi:hypothetical protein
MSPKADPQTAFEEVDWDDELVEENLEVLDRRKKALKNLKDPTTKVFNVAEKAFKSSFQDFVREQELPAGTRIRCGAFVMTVGAQTRDDVLIPAYDKLRATGIEKVND